MLGGSLTDAYGRVFTVSTGDELDTYTTDDLTVSVPAGTSLDDVTDTLNAMAPAGWVDPNAPVSDVAPE